MHRDQQYQMQRRGPVMRKSCTCVFLSVVCRISFDILTNAVSVECAFLYGDCIRSCKLCVSMCPSSLIMTSFSKTLATKMQVRHGPVFF